MQTQNIRNIIQLNEKRMDTLAAEYTPELLMKAQERAVDWVKENVTVGKMFRGARQAAELIVPVNSIERTVQRDVMLTIMNDVNVRLNDKGMIISVS